MRWGGRCQVSLSLKLQEIRARAMGDYASRARVPPLAGRRRVSRGTILARGASCCAGGWECRCAGSSSGQVGAALWYVHLAFEKSGLATSAPARGLGHGPQRGSVISGSKAFNGAVFSHGKKSHVRDVYEHGAAQAL